MLITLQSDVSFDPTGLCAYAVQAKANGVLMQQSAMFRRRMKNLNVAEVCGIVNGLSATLKRFSPPAGSRILVENHSTTALEVLQGANRDPLFSEVLTVRTRLLAGTNIEVRYYHTKTQPGVRRKVNDTWCRIKCQEILRAYLEDEKKRGVP